MPSLSWRFEGDHSDIHHALTHYLRTVDISRDPFEGRWFINGQETGKVEKTFETLLASRLGPRADPVTQSTSILNRVITEKVTSVRLDHQTSSAVPFRIIDELRRSHPRLQVVLVWYGIMDSFGRYGWLEGELIDETFTREVEVVDSLGLPIVDETASSTFRENLPSGTFLTFLDTYSLNY